MNPILHSEVQEPVQAPKRQLNYLNSNQVKQNLLLNKTNKVDNVDKITNCTFSNEINKTNKKQYLKNKEHHFTGKRGFYC